MRLQASLLCTLLLLVVVPQAYAEHVSVDAYYVSRSLMNSTFPNMEVSLRIENINNVTNITGFVENSTTSYNVSYAVFNVSGVYGYCGNCNRVFNATMSDIPSGVEFNLSIIITADNNETYGFRPIKAFKLPPHKAFNLYEGSYGDDRIIRTNSTNTTNASVVIKLNTSYSGTFRIYSYLFDRSVSYASGLTALDKYIQLDEDDVYPFKKFMEWGIINVSYTDSELTAKGIENENLLRVLRYNETSGNWENTTGTEAGVNTVENYVWMNTTRFSQFGIFVNNTTSESPPPYATPYPTPAPSSSGGDSPSGGSSSFGGGGGGSSTNSWGTVTSDETEKEIVFGNKANFDLNGIVHTISFVKMNSTTAVFEIKSNPINVSLSAGETKELDLDEDNVYDLEIRLNGISGLKADITLKSVKEPVAVNQMTTLQDVVWEEVPEENTTVPTVSTTAAAPTGLAILPSNVTIITLVFVIAAIGLVYLKTIQNKHTSKKRK